MNYELDIEIDDSALDVEWLHQPALALKYGVYLAECRQTLQQAEETVKLIRAELIKKANDDSDRYLGKGVKPTGANIESYYRNHRRHKEAKEEWVKAQFEVNVAEVAYKEISTARKAALQNLVELHGQNYFAGPSVPRDLTYENLQKEKQKSSNKKIRMTRKK